jgi:hypothetical protein
MRLDAFMTNHAPKSVSPLALHAKWVVRVGFSSLLLYRRTDGMGKVSGDLQRPRGLTLQFGHGPNEEIQGPDSA